MGTYHPNLTDRAVLTRLSSMVENNFKELSFTVPKAKKKFILKIVTKKQAQSNNKVYVSELGSFTLEEVAFE